MAEKMTRRGFLEKAAAAAAGITVGELAHRAIHDDVETVFNTKRPDSNPTAREELESEPAHVFDGVISQEMETVFAIHLDAILQEEPDEQKRRERKKHALDAFRHEWRAMLENEEIQNEMRGRIQEHAEGEKLTTIEAAVAAYGQRYDVPKDILWGVMGVESGINPGVGDSSIGAHGIMQMIPDTFEGQINGVLKEKYPGQQITDEMRSEERRLFQNKDVDTMIRYGAKFLRFLFDRYGQWGLALGAYAGGTGTMQGMPGVEGAIDRMYPELPRNFFSQIDRANRQGNTEKVHELQQLLAARGTNIYHLTVKYPSKRMFAMYAVKVEVAAQIIKEEKENWK